MRSWTTPCIVVVLTMALAATSGCSGTAQTAAPAQQLEADRRAGSPAVTEPPVTQTDGSITTPPDPTTPSEPEQPRFYVRLDDFRRVRADMGCIEDLEASTLDDMFADRIGPLIGWDNPHVTDLGDGRWLWLVHDSYLDYTGEATTLKHDGPQIQNMAIEQTGTCFELIHGGLPADRRNFEIGDYWNDSNRFFWPLGSERHGDRVWVFWSETFHSDPTPGPGEGIVRHPVAVWLAEYDAVTLERLSFEKAPNSGVFPSYGFAVASDGEHSYLFGNSNLLNFQREGGRSAPHSATKMYLARVPLGEFDAQPEYRTTGGWSADPAAAVTISERFWAENTMQPRFIHGRWIAVTKEDGFWGDEVVIDVADDPWGPWVTVNRFVYEPRPSERTKMSYQPIILPWSGPDTGLQISMPENAAFWEFALDDPTLYRPRVIEVDWPADTR